MPTHGLTPNVPAHVDLTRWAIAAGLVGLPVAVVFRDYGTALVAEVFRRIKEWVGSKHVVHINCERDLRNFELLLARCGESESPRLVLLTHSKLIERTGWILSKNQRGSTSEAKSLPTLLALQQKLGSDNFPGLSLKLHGASSQTRLITQWLDVDKPFEPFPEPPFPQGVNFDAVQELFPPDETISARRPLPFFDKIVLKALLAGAALIRTPAGLRSSGPLLVGEEDYGTIHAAIQLTSTQNADAVFEPLAHFMVARANVYIKNRDAIEAKPKPPTEAPLASSDRRITRRELADLGNPSSHTIKELLAELHRMGPEGLDDFKKLGTKHGLHKEWQWPPTAPETLPNLLHEWSPKQVRTHFERLLKEGFITGSKTAGNQSWVYQLPEAMSKPDSPFKSLPKPGAPSPALACPHQRADQSP